MKPTLLENRKVVDNKLLKIMKDKWATVPLQGGHKAGNLESSNMIITVKILRGRECTIEAPGTSSVSFIKQLVARELDIPVDQQRLVFRGKTLSDSLCLVDYNIVDGTKLHLLVRKTESDEEAHSLWAELEKIMEKHFCREDTNKLLNEMKKDLTGVIQDSSLDDIERYARSFLNGESCQEIPSSSRPDRA